MGEDTVAGDPFRALGLPASAGLTDEDVRAAWRRIAARTHPDREDGGDLERFSLAAAAYETLRTSYGRGEALADLTAGGAPTGGRGRPRRPKRPGRRAGGGAHRASRRPGDTRRPASTSYPDDRWRPAAAGYPADPQYPEITSYPDDQGYAADTGYTAEPQYADGTWPPAGTEQPADTQYPDITSFPGDRGDPAGAGYSGGSEYPGGDWFAPGAGQSGVTRHSAGTGYPDGTGFAGGPVPPQAGGGLRTGYPRRPGVGRGLGLWVTGAAAAGVAGAAGVAALVVGWTPATIGLLAAALTVTGWALWRQGGLDQ